MRFTVEVDFLLDHGDEGYFGGFLPVEEFDRILKEKGLYRSPEGLIRDKETHERAGTWVYAR